MFSPEQIRKYAESIFPGKRITDRVEQRFACPIHNGKDKNFAFNLNRGVWTCHSHCGSGGLVQLEQHLHGGTREEATTRLFEAIGMSGQIRQKQVVAAYSYVGPDGKLIAEKLRLEPKDFSWRVPKGDRGYEYGGTPSQLPLYSLPGVLTANVLLVTEGEKDADSLNTAKGWEEAAGAMGRIHATTSGAAGSWKPHHSPFTAGKRVVIFEDGDDKGRASSLAIAESVYPFAHSVRIVRFDDLQGVKDVSDFLQSHTLQELFERIKQSPMWHPPQAEEEVSTIVEGIGWAGSASVETNWLVEGVIQAEGNGIICGDPKASKSMLALDLILHLISGTPWFGHRIRQRVKCGLVTREDAPGLTKTRIQKLLKTMDSHSFHLDGWLWVNSREQTKSFDILEDSEFDALVRDFKKQECQVVFFDVFNRLHRLDENDNQQMSQITARLSQFGAEVGCQVVIIHHLNKDTTKANVFNRLRGAGALHGWMEWGMAVQVVNEDAMHSEWIRKVAFESKEAVADDLFYQIESPAGYLKLAPVPAPFPQSPGKSRYQAPVRAMGIV